MFHALEGGLARIDFFNARSPENVMRTFRTLLSRAEPERQEAGLMQALGFEIQNYLDRLDQRPTPDPEEPENTEKPDHSGPSAPFDQG